VGRSILKFGFDKYKEVDITGEEVVLSEFNGSDVCEMVVELNTFNGEDMVRVGSEIVDFNGVVEDDGV